MDGSKQNRTNDAFSNPKGQTEGSNFIWSLEAHLRPTREKSRGSSIGRKEKKTEGVQREEVGR
jgi:hypothetical protein